MAVSFGNKRKEEAKDVELTSPTGAEIVVSASRAESLLKRAPLRDASGNVRGYTRGHKAKAKTEDKPSTPGRADRT